MLRLPAFSFLLLLTTGWTVQAQHAPWLAPSQPVVKLSVVEDGVYRVTGAELIARDSRFAGHPTANLHLRTQDGEHPLLPLGGSDALAPTDTFLFAGFRHRGADEAWAYQNYQRPDGAGTLYSDTTHYWLSAEPVAGLRYADAAGTPGTAAALWFSQTFESNDVYFSGATSNSGNPLYTEAEGYYADRMTGGGARERTVELDVSPGDSLYARVRVVGGSGVPHGATLTATADAAGQSFELGSARAEWTGYQTRTFEVRGLAPGAAQLGYRLELDAPVQTPDYVYFDYLGVRSARRSLPQSGAGMATVAADGSVGVEAGAAVFVPARGVAAYGAGAQLSVRAGDTLVYAAPNAVRAPAAVQAYQAERIDDASREVDYLIVTTAALRASADAHAAYRQQRGLRTLVVDQQDVFDQFDGGRQRPIAIRRLLYAAQDWAAPPRYVLFWGDALLPAPNRGLEPWEVISFGNSVSDAWYGMQYGGVNDWSELAGIGRAPVRSNQAGRAFSDKVQRYEASPPARWPKRGLFASGGFSPGEVQTLASYADRWATTSLTETAALDTLRIVKRNERKVDAGYLPAIEQAFENGIGWLAFFGHSSPQAWEIETAPAASYDNPVALPVILSFGCRTGAFSLGSADEHTLSLAEEFVTSAPTGAIAHWGSSELSTISAGGYLGDQVHDLVMRDTMRVLGDVFRTAKARMARFTTSGSNVKNLLQYGLVGDPATRFQLPILPNLLPEPASIAVTPAAPSLTDSTWTVEATLFNYGVRFADSLDVQLRHFGPNGLAATYTKRIGAFGDSTRVAFALQTTGLQAGEHRVEIAVDASDAIAEAVETDNAISQAFVVSTRALVSATASGNVFYGSPPTLSVTRAVASPDTGSVVIEFGTSPTFAPGTSQSVTRPLVRVAQFEPGGLEPGRYFWRFRDADDAFSTWSERSFDYAPELGRTGWVQTAPSSGETLLSGELQPPTEDRFVSISSERGRGQLVGSIAVGDTSLVTLTLGWGLVVLDGVTGQIKYAESLPTFDMSASLEARLNTNRSLAIARIDSLSRGLMPGGLNRGDVVLGRTRHLGRRGPSTVDDTTRAALMRLGSVAADTLNYSDHLWQMVSRVGYPEQTRERVVVRTSDSPNEVKWDTTLTFRDRRFTVRSEPIGGALAWLQAQAQTDLPAGVAAQLAVVDDATQTVLAAGEAGQAIDLSAFDPQQHPTLRLAFSITDARAYAPFDAQTVPAAGRLERWSLAHERLPSVALDAARVPASQVPEGDAFAFVLPITNLSAVPAEDVRVDLFASAPGEAERLVRTDTVGTLAAGASVERTFALETVGRIGTNRLRARLHYRHDDAAPPTGLSDYAWAFDVTGDATPPEYRITIDGQRLDPDPDPVANLQDPAFPFVSARPTIEVQVVDDNRFRALGDSTVVQLALNGAPVSLADPDVRFTPGDTLASLVYTPDLSASDSTYTLVLRAFDASGNEAAGSPYQVHFRVQTELEIESVLPYPNPMTSATTFAFRVKGLDAAEVREARLRVYTLTGQVVREFDLLDGSLDAGALRVGWNKLRWDGTDADGDRLGPGVYLYRVFLGGPDGSLGQTQVERLAIVR